MTRREPKWWRRVRIPRRSSSSEPRSKTSIEPSSLVDAAIAERRGMTLECRREGADFHMTFARR